MQRRSFLASGVSAALALQAGTAHASTPAFPAQPLRLVVPVAPGGLLDIAARALGDELTRSLSVPVIVENKPGGRFALALKSVANADPDGYTIGLATQGMLSLFPALYSDLGYKLEDFKALAPIFRFHVVVAVSADNPARNAAEFLSQAKRGKGPVLLGTTAIGGTPHLVAEELVGSAGLTTEPVVFRGELLAMQALIGGHVPAVAVTVPSVLELYRSGRVRILAFSGPQRLPALAEVPTMRELGIPNAEGASWAGLFAPAATPAPIAEKLATAIAEASFQSSYRKRLLPDMEPFMASPSEFLALARADSVKWGRLIREKGIAERMTKS